MWGIHMTYLELGLLMGIWDSNLRTCRWNCFPNDLCGSNTFYPGFVWGVFVLSFEEGWMQTRKLNETPVGKGCSSLFIPSMFMQSQLWGRIETENGDGQKVAVRDGWIKQDNGKSWKFRTKWRSVAGKISCKWGFSSTPCLSKPEPDSLSPQKSPFGTTHFGWRKMFTAEIL
jgi:hypothetical protein